MRYEFRIISASILYLLLVTASQCRVGVADDQVKPNVAFKTLGGTQFWSDELVQHNWRIQRNVLTGHYRLLDNEEFRHAWGTKQQCESAFKEIKAERNLPPMQGKVAIVLHGLGRSRLSMDRICNHLHDQGKYNVVNFGYASTREPIAEHAKALARVVDNLGTQVNEINFIGHSMGNIVVRHYLADQTKAKNSVPDRRIRRIVMLTPPNNGAKIASTLKNDGIFRLITGHPGQQLGANWKELEKHLAIPTCEFGIIAGGKSESEPGRNPILDGDDDWIVTVEETKLPGASDFIVVPRFHSGVLFDKETHQHVLRFLQHGHFVSAEARKPLPKTKRTVSR